MSGTSKRLRLSVGIKALNEELHIEKAIRSALAAVEAIGGGEVVVADSGSRDGTVEIARRYPVTVVTLADPSTRSCGTGAQLAFQHAGGDYFYMLDGDMELDRNFVRTAIDFLEAHPDVAAVGGLLSEQSTRGESFEILRRSIEQGSHWQEGVVRSLDGGGLYRTAAIRQVGYFADRNLHAFEEAELAVRLRSRGWKLVRLGQHAVDHYGYTMSGYRLLLRRLKSGYATGVGQVLRASLGQPHFFKAVSTMKHVTISILVVAWWLTLAAVLLSPLPFAAKSLLIAAAILIPFLLLSWRRRSLRLGLYSFVEWNVSGLGLLLGLFRPRRDPAAAIPSTVLQQGSAPASADSSR